MAGELVTYGRRVNLLLVEIADDLTRKDCEKLCFIYGDLFPASFKELHGENALMLLMKLRDQRVFSNDRPEMLANLMGDLQLLHLKSRVEDFIGQFNHPCIYVALIREIGNWHAKRWGREEL